MRRRAAAAVLVAASFVASASTQQDGARAPAARTEWQALPRLPDSQGFAGGFCGVTGGALLFAGG